MSVVFAGADFVLWVRDRLAHRDTVKTFNWLNALPVLELSQLYVDFTNKKDVKFITWSDGKVVYTDAPQQPDNLSSFEEMQRERRVIFQTNGDL